MSEQAQTSSALEQPRELRLLSFISEHFAVFSLLGLLFAVLCSTLFLYGYLTVFDQQLIWIIEYPDILKFGLVALAVLSTIILIVQALIANAISAARLEGKTRAAAVGVIIAVTLALWAISVIIEWRTQAAPRYEMYVFLGISAVLLIALSVAISDVIEGRIIKVERIAFVVVGLFVSLGAFGATFGTYAKYSKGPTHDVFLKDREMTNVRLVLFTTHHTVLYAGTDVVVIPTSGIMKIVAHPATQQRWP